MARVKGTTAYSSDASSKLQRSSSLTSALRWQHGADLSAGIFQVDPRSTRRSLKKEDASKDKKKEAIPQPDKMRALAEKISGHLKKEDKPTLLTSQPKEPEISQKVDVSEEVGMPEVTVA
ncbi:hypothetical protein AK812_SmicGene19777 [Symbiodinium microadriaticum]|uniref:Uncharacterized protein n=1 Tax=Symbiodinium microadriaticum TaxID=2951 RepID=A0A1Q9DRN1_SYMMI|nr:hypothetical protein AK812_SmicGene19777 [Symbiodinium microadriaticum]